MAHLDRAQENAYLEEVLDYINENLPALVSQQSALDARVSYAFKHMNIDNPEQFNEMTVNLSLLEGQKTKVAQMQYALNKPYFARVDFKTEDADEVHYIGKMTLLKDLKMLITDWRAPVSSLYYEGRIGQASYDCIDGTIAGSITLKRQYQIENGVMEGFTDVDVTANDEFLQAALGASKDRRLGDIVATIQAEQNKIIRAPLNVPLIVQGVAGSGKTTIALHRIAYLLYTHGDKLKASDIMIMAPSRFFLSYISDVLPDLGVNQVVQTTFEDYICDTLDLSKWNIVPPLSALSEAINDGVQYNNQMETARLKSGLDFVKVIDRYFYYIQERSVPKDDFAVEEFLIFPLEKVKDMFDNSYRHLPTGKRKAEIEKFLKSALAKELPKIIIRIESEYNRIAEEHKKNHPECEAKLREIFAERNATVKQVKAKAKTACKQYTKTFQLKDVLTYYQALFTTPGLLQKLSFEVFSPEECEILTKQSQQLHKKKMLEFEDLAPLIWLQKRLYGMDSDIKHIVIDEAQDLSIFQFMALKSALPKASFSILGDLHQGILSHKGITDWHELFPIFDVEPFQLSQSYRTTVEIMEKANEVISRLYPKNAEPDVPFAVPVIRHGGPVRNYVIGKDSSLASSISAEVLQALEDGFRSIAIIGKTLPECEALQKDLHNLGHDYPIIAQQESPYEGGVIILPVYLAKGLEFDVVIITDSSKYTTEPLDTKLQYIAITRALHRLVEG